MWGRLDGCGWLVHVLLDPRRIISVLENDRPFPGTGAARFLARLGEALDTQVPKDVVDDLGFLDDPGAAVPASLPRLSLWVASVLQRHIAAEELPVVAAQVEAGLEQKPAGRRPASGGGHQGKPSSAALAWLAMVRGTDWTAVTAAQIRRLLDDCPVGEERITEEAKERTPLFIRTATQAAAVATAAGTAVGPTPASLRPTFATVRTITRTAFAVADRTHGVRRTMGLTALVVLAVGVLALLTHVSWLGFSGLVLIGAALVLLPLAVRVGARDGVALTLAVVLGVIAAAPWLPFLGDRIFPWLSGVAVPAMTTRPWIWPVLVFLVLLPPGTTVLDWVRRRLTARPAPVATVAPRRAAASPGEAASAPPRAGRLSRRQHRALAAIPQQPSPGQVPDAAGVRPERSRG
jgi:hypothetical protein